MNLENFDIKSTIVITQHLAMLKRIIINILVPLNLLEVMIKANEDTKLILNNFSVNLDNLYLESHNNSKILRKKIKMKKL